MSAHPIRKTFDNDGGRFRISIAKRMDDRVFQPADISGPGALAEKALNLVSHSRDLDLAQIRIFPDEVPRQGQIRPGSKLPMRCFKS